MGPESTIMSTSDTFKFIKLEKLKDDGTNWVTYRERVTNTMTHKGLRRHFLGTKRKPGTCIELDGKFYKIEDIKKKDRVALTDKEAEDMEEALDEYERKEASVREVIYETISQSMFLQIKNEPTASKLWSKLVSIMQEKGDLIQVSILTKLQTMICLADDDVRAHLGKMKELKEQLEGMGAPVSDPSFAAMIRKSLPPCYRPLLQTLSAAARINNKTLTSDQIITSVHKEADELVVQKEADKAAENAAMIAAYAKKKEQSQKKKCSNCKKTGHMKEECFRKGGGKEGQAPWDKKKKDEAKANAASTEDVSLAVTYSPSELLEALGATPATTIAIMDCGATQHFTPNRSDLLNFTEIEPRPIRAANGQVLQATGRGDLGILFPMKNGQKPVKATLRGVYYSPDFTFTLISVGTMVKKGFRVVFEDDICTISTPKPTRRIISDIPVSNNGLYKVSITPKGDSSGTEIATVASKKVSISEFHRRMGHVNHDDLRHMIKEGTATGIDLDMNSKPEQCVQCIEAKATTNPFPKEGTKRATKYGGKVVADLWGPAQSPSLKGKEYYLTFIDEYTHETRIYFLRNKSEAFETYKIYEKWVNMQRDARIKLLGTDRGGEFTSDAFSQHLKKAGTARHLTVHDSPQSNGRAERANRVIVEGARAMLLAAKLPKPLWAEAASHFVWLRNRVPTKALPDYKTPIQMSTGNCPDLSNVRQWGHKVWVKRTHSPKLESKVEKGRFIGFDEESKGYRIYWEEKRSVTVERDVYFDESDASAPETTLIEGETHQKSNQAEKRPKAVNPAESPKSHEIKNTAGQSDNASRKDTENASQRAQNEVNPTRIGEDTTKLTSPVIQNPTTPSIQNPSIQPSEDEEEVAEELLGRSKRARPPQGFYKALMKGDKPSGGGMTAFTEKELDYQLSAVDLDDEIGRAHV